MFYIVLGGFLQLKRCGFLPIPMYCFLQEHFANRNRRNPGYSGEPERERR